MYDYRKQWKPDAELHNKYHTNISQTPFMTDPITTTKTINLKNKFKQMKTKNRRKQTHTAYKQAHIKQ